MKNKPNSSELVILDVFEIVGYKPVLKYKISVVDKFIILISNNDVPTTGVSKCVNEKLNERLVIYELTDEEKSTLGIPLTHKFRIKIFGKYNLFLNLSNKDLINLGFKEPKTSMFKRGLVFIKKFHKILVWVLAGILLLLSIIVAGFELYDRLNKQKDQKESNPPIEKQNTDYNNISKIDSLSNN